MKKVLLISNLFPPVGGVGAQRNLKYVKYLPQFGWRPFVLTIKPDYFFLQDEELLKDVPKSAKIFRTFCLKPKQKNISWIKFDTKKKQNHRESEKTNIVKWIMKFIEKELIIPDIWIGWLPFALLAGDKIIKENKIDAIFCSGPAFTSFLVGYILSRKSKLSLVLDYRDGWILNSCKQTYSCNILKKTAISNIEKIILRYAFQIIFVSDSLFENYCDKFKFVKEKSNVITNGFDAEDFSSITTTRKREREITISHIGKCDIDREPVLSVFFDIIENLLKQQKDVWNNLEILFVGPMIKNVQRQIGNYNLEKIVRVKDFVSHSKSLEFMSNSDILLLLIDLSPYNKDILTGKLFEYLGAKRPILAFGPKDGAAAKVIRETKSGIVVDYETEKKEEMIKKTSSFINQVLNNQFRIDNDKSLKKYERKEITRQLAGVLDKTVRKC